MSLPAADFPVPIAVLVLAWDETTPAVRALVEATQAAAPTVESILVMVPQAAAPNILSAEEYLPLPSPAAPAPPPPPAPKAAPDASASSTAAAVVLPEAVSEPTVATASIAPALPTLRRADYSAAAPVPLGWSAVQVLRLGAMSLAGLSQRAGQPLPSPPWQGLPAAPAAPYQGATAAPSLATPALAQPIAAPAAPAATVEASVATREPTKLTAASYPPAPTVAPYYEPAEQPSQGADLEADLLPSEADDLADFELTTAALPEQLAQWEDLLSPAQAGWPEALAALQQPEPAAPTPPPAVYEAAAGLPARPAAPQYAAPDLNFQVIQYARFAVPVALAEEPYAAIYAPAWPTWLAAQELRQRTGWPLVLHVTTLAAADDESLETATGWIAELQRQALRRADVILAETPALAQRLRHELGLPAATVHTVPAADATVIAQALHAARPRLVANLP